MGNILKNTFSKKKINFQREIPHNSYFTLPQNSTQALDPTLLLTIHLDPLGQLVGAPVRLEGMLVVVEHTRPEEQVGRVEGKQREPLLRGHPDLWSARTKSQRWFFDTNHINYTVG